MTGPNPGCSQPTTTAAGGAADPSIQLLELRRDDLGLQRNEDLFLRHHVLAFAREHELQEFPDLRLERLPGLAVHVVLDEAAERLLLRIDVLGDPREAQTAF